MKKIAYSFAVVLLASCNSSDFPPAHDVPCQAPFANLANSGATQEDQAILREASEDFCAVVAGKNPTHAKFDNAEPPLTDGGTKFYIGNKYRLTVVNSISSFGSLNGIAHGPIIKFDESFAPGNTNVISNVRVYPFPQDAQSGR